jgi:cold shock CspA family protein
MNAGEVKFFNEVEQYGFIIPKKGGDDLFFRISDVIDQNPPSQGDVVEFEVELLPKGPRARKVAKLASAKNKRVSPAIKRSYEARMRRKQGIPVSSVRAGAHDHRIENLKPSLKWVLLIDETGNAFTKSEEVNPTFLTDEGKKGLIGKFVGILMPNPTPVPEVASGTHFADLDDIDEMDKIVQDLLDEPVGIWGVNVGDLPDTSGQRWVDGVMHVVKWILRLLPLGGDATEIEILVEQRAEHSAKKSNWDALLRDVLSGLSETNPERYSKLTAEIRIVAKSGGKWTKHLPYADAIAHTWGSSVQDAKARLRASGLLGTCLHQGEGKKLMRAWDLLKQGTTLGATEWQNLVHDPDARVELGITTVLLSQVAESCRKNPDLWRRYLKATQEHLESKAIDITALGKEVEWLASCKPDDQMIPPAQELAWFTTQLENRNHLGEISYPSLDRMEDLATDLFEESPQLVCQADLARAVLATNQFNFDGASKALERWSNTPKGLAGLRHWARVQSSHGQHAAFRGDLNEANQFFNQAIDAFERLSQEGEAGIEISQTACYRTIAAMDNGGVNIEAVREYFERIAPLGLENIKELAGSDAVEEKYTHHLLLRYLHCRGNEVEHTAYLEAKDSWLTGEGHPWPLIEAYRAILIRPLNAEESLSRMENGFRLATEDEQGPTVRLIGLTCGIIVQGWGGPSLVSETDLNEIESFLPAASDRISLLRDALFTPFDPAEALLAAVLPFNFR